MVEGLKLGIQCDLPAEIYDNEPLSSGFIDGLITGELSKHPEFEVDTSRVRTVCYRRDLEVIRVFVPVRRSK